MMDTFAQILDEALFGIQAIDSAEALKSFEVIKELLEELAESLHAGEIPEEVILT